MAGLLRGLEATAQIVTTLGNRHDAPDIDTNDVAHMMATFRETLSTIRDVVLEIAEMADEAMCAKAKKLGAVK